MLSTSIDAETRSVSAAASALLSKFLTAAGSVAGPDVLPTIRPEVSTVATAGSLLDHTKTTLEIGTESADPTICHARAVATVSLPRNRTRIRDMLTCTKLSCSVGTTHVPAPRAAARATSGARRGRRLTEIGRASCRE